MAKRTNANPKTSRPRGRPSLFKPAIAAGILERLADGEGLRKICRDESMPTARTVQRWIATRPDFCQQCSASRQLGVDLIAEEVVEIADNLAGDVGRDGLRCRARMWWAARISPKKYGERVMTELSGVDGKPIEHATVPAMPLSVAAQVRDVFEKAEARLGLKPPAKASLLTRAEAIASSGSVMTPEQYEAVFRARQAVTP
jgi:hypothetical protein